MLPYPWPINGCALESYSLSDKMAMQSVLHGTVSTRPRCCSAVLVISMIEGRRNYNVIAALAS